MTEKILAAHLREGTLERGREIGIRIDHCLTQDSTGTMAWLEFEALGMDRVKADVVVSYSDHTSLGFKGESTDDHVFLQTIASHYGALFSKNGNGVCHQLHYERFGVPGKTLIGSDSHTPTSGGLGMLAIGAGGMDVAVAMGGGLFHLTVPKMMRVILTGHLPANVSAKDIALEVLRRISVKGGVGFFLEYAGPGVETLSVPERATITNMGTETGATSSIFPSDEVTRAFLRMQGRESDWAELRADDDAVYDETLEIDLSTLRPLVAMPGMPDNVFDIEEVAGTKLDQVFIGSCTNGSYRDLKVVAEMLKGKKVSNDIDVIVSPGSRQAWEMLIEDGSFLELTRAGVRMIEPGCNACIGIGFVPGTGHLSLRTVNRNWQGRGGNKNGKLALCGPEVAAASALRGEIADPLDLPAPEFTIDHLTIDDYLILAPEGPAVEIRRSPNIVPLAKQTPIESTLEGEVLLKLADGVSTDAILPAGPLTQHGRIPHRRRELRPGKLARARGPRAVAPRDQGRPRQELRPHPPGEPDQHGNPPARRRYRRDRSGRSTGDRPLGSRSWRTEGGKRIEGDSVHGDARPIGSRAGDDPRRRATRLHRASAGNAHADRKWRMNTRTTNRDRTIHRFDRAQAALMRRSSALTR